MGSLKSSPWTPILVHMLLLQLRCVKVQRIDPVSQKLRQLNAQFLQFKVLTQARLDMLALNQNKNSSLGLENHVQELNDHYHHISHNLDHLKQSTTQEIEGLRGWNRKLEKKNKRMEGRLAVMERNLRKNRHHVQKEMPDLGQDFTNLTLELQNQEERVAALQVQRDELLIGLKGLQESLKNQALRVTRLEGRLSEALQWNGVRNVGVGEPPNPGIPPQEYDGPQRRAQTPRGGRRILGGYGQPRPEERSPAKTDQSRLYHATNHPKLLKVQKPRSHPQMQEWYPNPKPQSTDDLLQPDLYHHSQSQIQMQAQTRPYPIQWEQLQPHPSASSHHAQIPPQDQLMFQPSSLSQAQTHSQHSKDKQSRNRPGAHELQPSDIPSQSQPDSYQPRVYRKGEEEESDTKVETSVIHSFLRLPVRHKIPEIPVPKKDATICNVDSMLFFPSASAENYVTFSLTLPDLPELSVCLWLRVEASHVGTLLSYATNDNDNQLVLYGHNPTSVPASSSSFDPSYSSSPFSKLSYPSASSPSLDFVIGDPIYRRLPTSSLLDARWHHLCILWSSIQGRFWHYHDRRLISSGSNFRKDWEIPGGGSVVLGQEQDSIGGGFDPAEGFAGQVAGFRMWNRVLNPSEVEGLAEGKGVPRGVVLGMEDIREVHGEVQQVACECLEHCV